MMSLPPSTPHLSPKDRTTRSPTSGEQRHLCKGWVLSTPEEADRLWMETKAGNQLGFFLREQWEHQNNWLINLGDRVFGSTDGKSGAAGCSVLDNDCSPMNNIECTEQYEKYGTDDSLSKTSYWIFQATKGMHSKFKALKTKITEKTIISGLRVGQMVTDFGGNEDDTVDMVKWLASASTMGAALSGLSTNEIDQGTISAGLADLFEAAVDRLDETMRIVMGGGTEDQYNALKTPNPDPYKPVANFFNGGFFLLNDNAEAMQMALNSVYGNIQPKVSNNVMKAAKFYLVADKRRTGREDCGYATGRQWMALEMPNRVGDWAEVSGEVYDKMASYGLGNREVYYRAILDCALNPNDNVDLGSLVGGKIPTCYFDLPAVYIDKDREVGCGDPFTTVECGYISATNIE
ncbi:hypothetical protein FOXYS1_13411 [Fusarium oxysporum]|uniref:Uncharacterized protein n=1 Tax=Fusarium oxysporum TaxID=5507 RepID=A0A8H5ED09_FUSOX|nr:hypothetical protein FOXYS1_13411 [Fusarium oxysporum]